MTGKLSYLVPTTGKEENLRGFCFLYYYIFSFFFLFPWVFWVIQTSPSTVQIQFSDYQIIEILPSCIDFYNKVLKIMLNPPISSKLC
jgi:hypothetical protein